MPEPSLLIFDTVADTDTRPEKSDLYQKAAAFVARQARASVAARRRFLLALSGGSTPEPLFRRLAQPPYRDGLPWAQTHVFWADERAVPPDHPASNYGQAQRLLLERVAVPPEQIYRIPGEEDPLTAAEAYANVLRRQSDAGRAWPRLDLVLLGMGSDGHTASLFPGSAFPIKRPQPTMAVSVKYGDRPAGRVTLTPGIINDARQILFLVTGESKAEALAAVLEGEPRPVQLPAQRVQPRDGAVCWMIDRAAAQQLQQV